MRAVSSSSPSVKHIVPGHPVTVHVIRPHAYVAAGVSVYTWYDPVPGKVERSRMERVRKVRFDIAGDILSKAVQVTPLEKGTVTTFGVLQDLVHQSEFLFIRPAALDVLARRDHNRQELIQKLVRRGFSREAAASAADQLQAQGYQDDLRAAESWVRSIMRRNGKSRAYVLAGLAKRGYDRDVAARAVRSYEEEHPGGFEDALIRHIAKTVRAVSGSEDTANMTVDQRHSVFSRLLRHGFSMKEIQQHFR